MAQKTVAATLVAPRQLEFREYDLPEISADDGLLKMEAVGICGADVHTYQESVPKPRVMGHENVGVIAGVGAEAAKRWGVKEGDLVIPEEYIPCFHCKYCYTGRFRFCNQTDRGHDTPILRHGQTTTDVWPSIWGGFGEYMYLPPNTVMHRIERPVPAHVLALYLPLADGIEWVIPLRRRPERQDRADSGSRPDGAVGRVRREAGRRRLRDRHRHVPRLRPFEPGAPPGRGLHD